MEQKLSLSSSTIIECTLFALIHQIHHGIIKTTSGLTFLPFSGALWFILMFLVSWMFASLRARSGSIFVAILAHIIFNLTMNTTIFLFLW
ncbi:CPBP family glutamic-type intramembrane protease [Cellvibrio mixtus]|uniref:CPBP family glutamic-type intramembrane protease n=1 Tax=Cellvibrio mixtus TaxID=39650 RepID=UPI0009FE29E6